MTGLRHGVEMVVQRSIFAMAALVFAILVPAPYVFADAVDQSTPSASTCSPVAPAPTGIQKPTGSDAGTYTYNSCTGLWENQYYTWNPATQIATPKTPLTYTCNIATWLWMTHVWAYNPAASAFQQVAVSVSTLPNGAVVSADSLNPCSPPPAIAQGTPVSAGDTATTTTGAGQLSDTTTASIGNTLGSNALTGNAIVTGNTTAGSAVSGNALAIANILNAIASNSSLNGGNVATFTANINGDVQGNLIVDPGQLQPASTSDPLTNTGLTVNVKNSGQITNNINLAAATGNATVSSNTSAGSATSGNAAAIADVVNMLNSIISAGQSFVGVININGNMHGNILVPQKFLDSLIASNVPSSTVDLTPIQASGLGITTANSLSTTNTITSSASTGSAAVAGNTKAGSATSGNASTKVTVFNLTGNQVIGANALLVFVNVSGKWVGVLMNAPAGATAAAFGSGITGNTINDAVISAANDSAINNNITLAAKSGDATVADNTSAGNANTGNANTAANLLNINNAGFNLSGWFGVLFINIFGDWYGSFGVYHPPVSTSGGSPKPDRHTQAPAEPRPVFRFVPTAAHAPAPASIDTISKIGQNLSDTSGKVLGDISQAAQTPVVQPADANRLQMLGGILLALGLLALATERVISARHTSGQA